MSARADHRARTRPALVSDLDLRNAVWGARGLGRAGVPVHGLAPRRSAAGLRSRHVEARGRAGDVLQDPAGFLAGVEALADERHPLVLYPVREESIAATAALWDEPPPGILLPFSRAALPLIRDKAALEALAESAGLRTPRTLGSGTAAELAGAETPVPCVVKPALPGGALATARIAHDADTLEALLASLPGDERLILQERAVGPLVSLALVLDRQGNVTARFQEVARRTWPPEAGSIALSESVAAEDELVERAARMLRAAGYWGLAQLDLIAGPAGPALLDVNPRFYGCMPLALACGVNLPAAWHAAVIDRSFHAPAAYTVGLRYRWLEGDVYAALRGSPGRLMRPARRARAGAMWDRTDPLPSALLALEAAARPVLKRLPGGGVAGPPFVDPGRVA